MLDFLKRKIESNDVISFDIFDTLLFRNIHKATDLFKILENFVKANYKVPNFAELRIAAEADARSKVENRECTFDEIYDVISKRCAVNVRAVKERELDLEYEFSTVNPFMKQVFDYAKARKKKILLISDMYLPESFIKKLLDKSGYNGYQLFVSASYRRNKGTGGLFAYVKNSCSADTRKWLHIGDNYHSDYEMPLSLGMNAFLYKNVSTYENDDPKTVGECIFTGIKNNLLYNGERLGYWEEFGAKYAAPLYFGFTNWLYKLTKDEDNLYFIARDGYAIHKLYDKICEVNKTEIYTKYVYCSRQSLQIPAMALSEKMDDAVKFLSIRHGITDNDQTLATFLQNARIDTSDIEPDILSAFGFESLDDLVTVENHPSAQKLMALFSDDMKDKYSRSYEIALEYLKQCDMNKWKKINIMDIGWSGHIQDSLEKILSIPTRGYYFGTVESGDVANYCNMYGWAFDFDRPIELKQSIFYNVMMYELLFSAPHGSCLGYEKAKDGIEPVLKNNVPFNNIVEAFQASALSLCEKVLDYYHYIDFLRPEFCVKAYDGFIERRSEADLRHFAKLTNDIAIGNNTLYSYVTTITSKDMAKGASAVQEKASRSIWSGTYVYDESVSESEKRLFKYNQDTSLVENYLKFDLSCVRIYFDLGNGLNETDSVIVKTDRQADTYHFRFDVPVEARCIRIDPVENHSIIVSDLSLSINGVPHEPQAHNGDEPAEREVMIFSTKDPWIMYAPKLSHIETVEFTAKIKIIG